MGALVLRLQVAVAERARRRRHGGRGGHGRTGRPSRLRRTGAARHLHPRWGDAGRWWQHRPERARHPCGRDHRGGRERHGRRRCSPRGDAPAGAGARRGRQGTQLGHRLRHHLGCRQRGQCDQRLHRVGHQLGVGVDRGGLRGEQGCRGGGGGRQRRRHRAAALPGRTTEHGRGGRAPVRRQRSPPTRPTGTTSMSPRPDRESCRPTHPRRGRTIQGRRCPPPTWPRWLRC